MTLRRALTALTAVTLTLLTAMPAHAATPAPSRHAVLFITGYGTRIIGPTHTLLEDSMRDAGFDVIVADVDDMTGDLTESAHRIVSQGRALLTDGYSTVDLVGWSAGGLAARTAVTIDHAEGHHTFHVAVSVGGPLNGVDLPALGPGWECDKPACAQMNPTSPFMTRLPPLPRGRNATAFYSLWSQDDLVVSPAEATLPGAVNIHIQEACPGVQNIWTGHEHLMSSPAYADLTVDALTGGSHPESSVYHCAIGAS